MGQEKKGHPGGKGRKSKSCRPVGRTPEKSPITLLDNLAAVLNGCDEAGINPMLTNLGVLTDIGYVLPVANGWVVRTREFTPFSSTEEED
jgi:hypothetical protein